MLRNLRNELDFAMKRIFRHSARARRRAAVEATLVEQSLRPQGRPRFRELSARYDLRPWPVVCDQDDYEANLYILDLLDQLFARDASQPGGPCLDIGSRSWWYAPAQAAFLDAPWTGIEIDAHQRYLDMTTRRARAEFMSSPYPGLRYIAGSLLDLEASFGFITWILPYLLMDSLVSDRLPERLFMPRRLLAHAFSLLSPGGTLVILNHTMEEHDIQAALLAELQIPVEDRGQLRGIVTRQEEQRFAFVARRPTADGASAA